MKSSVLFLTFVALFSCKSFVKEPRVDEEKKQEPITEDKVKIERPSKDPVVVPDEKKTGLPSVPSVPADSSKPVVTTPSQPGQLPGYILSDANLAKADDNLKKFKVVIQKYPAATTLQTRAKRAEDLLAVVLQKKNSDDMFNFCASVAPLGTGLTVDRILTAEDKTLARSYLSAIRDTGGPCDLNGP